MVEGGRSQGKRTVEQKLAGSGEQQISAANDFADLHGGIIDNNGELIRRNIVMTPNDKVSEVATGDK